MPGTQFEPTKQASMVSLQCTKGAYMRFSTAATCLQGPDICTAMVSERKSMSQEEVLA